MLVGCGNDKQIKGDTKCGQLNIVDLETIDHKQKVFLLI